MILIQIRILAFILKFNHFWWTMTHTNGITLTWRLIFVLSSSFILITCHLSDLILVIKLFESCSLDLELLSICYIFIIWLLSISIFLSFNNLVIFWRSFVLRLYPITWSQRLFATIEGPPFNIWELFTNRCFEARPRRRHVGILALHAQLQAL